jgi:hypothetical protein
MSCLDDLANPVPELLVSAMTPILLLCAITWVPGSGDGFQRGNMTDAWQDAVAYRMPDDPVTKDRLARAADWLKRHRVTISLPDDNSPLSVIAWKDPTLEPANPKLLAGYVITDTLWAAKALKLLDPPASLEIEASIQRLGWYGNGLHDVLFHPVEKLLHRPADQDHVHGFSLGRFPVTDDRVVDLRVFRQKWDADFAVGHPSLFAEHAVYQALCDFWQGHKEQARRRILEVIQDDRDRNPKDRIFWDDRGRILVDYVNFEEWLGFRRGDRPLCRHYTFKLGVLLYAIRLLGLEPEIGPRLAGMKRRLWDAQSEDGGVSHFVDVRSDGDMTRGRGATGEASAIAILSETVARSQPTTDRESRRLSMSPFAQRGYYLTFMRMPTYDLADWKHIVPQREVPGDLAVQRRA